MDDQHEEVEHIPWGELLARTDDGRRRILYLVAGALAAMVVGVVVTRAMSPRHLRPQPVAPAVEVVATTVPIAAPVPVAARRRPLRTGNHHHESRLPAFRCCTGRPT